MIALFFHAKVFEVQDISVKIDCMCLLANLLSQQEWQLCVFWWYCCSPKSDVLWGNWPLFNHWLRYLIPLRKFSNPIMKLVYYFVLAIAKMWTLLAVATLHLTLIFWNKPISHTQLFCYEWVPYSLATKHLQYWHLLIDLYGHLRYKDLFLDMNIYRMSKH